MKTTIQKTKNSFSTSALRGGRLRKSCRGVVSSALFLTGMAAVVLGLMLALSTPSFAQSVAQGGINIERDAEGDINVSNGRNISLVNSPGSTGIRVVQRSVGDVVLTNRGNVMADHNGIRVNQHGISANNYVFGGDITVTNEAGALVSARLGAGIFLYSSGGVGIINRGTIKGGSGVSTNQASNKGDTEITNENFIWGQTGDGIDAYRNSDGDIVIANRGTMLGKINGIIAEHINAGDIVITNTRLVQGETNDGVNINKRYGVGDVVISNKGSIQGKRNGIYAYNNTSALGPLGPGDIAITNEGSVSGETGHGIHALFYGTGNIPITNEGTIIAGDTGIYANHLGHTGNIGITNKLLVDADGTGIHAEHIGTGDIAIKIDDGSTVIGEGGYGIKADHTDTGVGNIEIDLSGTVLGNDDDGAISMTSSGDKTLILRPGFGLNVGQIVQVNITSAGTGDGILELNQDDDPLEEGATHASATLDFGTLDFQGFDEFAKKGQNKWKISGVASDTEKFDTATIWEGTLGFTGGTTFKMAPAATGADPNYFKIENNAVLEVVGSNTLNGNLYNLGEIVFTHDPSIAQNPASVLTVGTDYRGGGKVIFDVGSGSWQADKLSIGRNNVNPTEVTKVRMLGEVSNFVSANNEYLPMVVEVTGTANPGSFVADESSGHDVNHHKYVFGHHPDTDAQGNITLHKWKFRRGAELSDVSGMGASYGDDLTTQVDPEEITPDPDDEDEDNGLGLRADVRGHEGGVWGNQQSLRTSSGSSVIAVRGSRKEDHRVYFGYDTPAMGFMGGDMVVRTSVSRGLSISDVFTSSGRNRINMESDAAALSALWQSPGGFYAGGGTRYVRSLSNISTRGFALARDNEGVGVGASAKAGYRFAVPVGGMDFSVAPQVQLLWSSVDFDDFTGLTGEVVSLEDGELVTGRLGLLWNGEWQDASGSGRIYGKMNLHNALDGETTVSVSGVPLSRERSDLSTDGHLGVSYEWNEGYAVRGEVTALQRDDAEEIRANFAMSIDF